MPEEANSFEFLEQLEEFFCSPAFTSAVGDFLAEHSSHLEYKPLDEEQPLKNHDIFQKYSSMMEQQLEAFMVERGLTPQAVYSACQKVSESGEAAWLTCIDYLMASTEYESFMQLAYDYYCMLSYEPNNDTDYALPPEEDDQQAAAAEEVSAGEPLSTTS